MLYQPASEAPVPVFPHVNVGGNEEVASKSGDEVRFSSITNDELVIITLKEAATGRTTLLGPVLGEGYPVVDGPSEQPFVGTVAGRIGLTGEDTFYDDDGTNALLISEYVPETRLKGTLTGNVEVSQSPDEPGRQEEIEVSFEVEVPPDYVPFLGSYECVVP